MIGASQKAQYCCRTARSRGGGRCLPAADHGRDRRADRRRAGGAEVAGRARRGAKRRSLGTAEAGPVHIWHAQALVACADLSGRTPDLLVEALSRHPMVAVPQLIAGTGVTRPALHRNLGLFEARGLVREVTRQGRFRVWAARG